MSILNPFYKLKYPSFSPTTLLYSFLNAPTPSNTFQRHFRTSSFLNVPPKPILQIEVPILYTHNFTLQLFECSNTKQYFSKGISEQVLFIMSILNPFYKLKFPSFSPTTLLYSFLNAQHQAILFKRHFRTSSFLSDRPKPILQIEVPILFTHNFTLQLFESTTPSNTFQKAFQNNFFS